MAAFERRPDRACVKLSVGPASETRHNNRREQVQKTTRTTGVRYIVSANSPAVLAVLLLDQGFTWNELETNL